MHQTTIAVGGENLIDIVDRDGEETALPGGSPFNVAMALGRQGAPVHYVSPISTDHWGDMLAAQLVGSGVVLSGGRRDQPTTLARVIVAGGIPSYRFERDGTAEREVSVDSLRAALPGGSVAIHTGSLTLTDGEDAAVWERFCAECFRQGAVCSLDPNVRLSVVEDPDAYRARILRMAARTHILKLSDEDLQGLFPTHSEADAIQTLRAGAAVAVLILTRGENGVSAWCRNDRLDLAVAAVPDLVDTVGAGDTFMATVLAGLAAQGLLTVELLNNLTPSELTPLLRRAMTAAAINCTRSGCNPPSLDELTDAMTEKT